jgi:hypothetical protein
MTGKLEIFEKLEYHQWIKRESGSIGGFGGFYSVRGSASIEFCHHYNLVV